MTKNGKEQKNRNVDEEQPNDKKKFGLLKMHVGNTKGVKLNMKFFLFPSNRRASKH
jgi:hypothetical protein